jgi:hypothetical protein
MQDLHDQINDYQSQLDKGLEFQELMKNANAIVKKHEAKKLERGLANKELVAIGLTYTQAEQVLTPDFMGRKGFPQYKLTNNNANNKRLKDRIEQIKTKLQGAKAVKNTGQAEEYVFDGGTIEVNYEIDRVQILFPGGRVDKELFKKLRSNGYVYSPTNQAFQRKITPQAIRNAIYLFDAKKIDEPNLEQVEGKKQPDELTEDDFEAYEKMYDIITNKAKKQSIKNFDEIYYVYEHDVKIPLRQKKSFDEIVPTKTIKEVWYGYGNLDRTQDERKPGYKLLKEFKKGEEQVAEHYFDEIAETNETPETPETKMVSTHYDKLKEVEGKKVQLPQSIWDVISQMNFAGSKIERADIWNEYRSLTLPIIKKTLWQIALDKPYTEVFKTGKEKLISFGGFDLLRAIKSAYAEQDLEISDKKLNPEIDKPKKETLGSVSGGAFEEYADIEDELINQLELQGKLTRSDAQGILEANEEFAKDQYGIGVNTPRIAEKILALGKKTEPKKSEPFFRETGSDGYDSLIHKSKKEGGQYVPRDETTETHLEPNTPQEFDEAIFDHLDEIKSAQWIGNIIKQRIILKEIYSELHGPELEKHKEVERLFKAFYEREKANPEYNGTTELKFDPVHPWITEENTENLPVRQATKRQDTDKATFYQKITEAILPKIEPHWIGKQTSEVALRNQIWSEIQKDTNSNVYSNEDKVKAMNEIYNQVFDAQREKEYSYDKDLAEKYVRVLNMNPEDFNKKFGVKKLNINDYLRASFTFKDDNQSEIDLTLNLVQTDLYGQMSTDTWNRTSDIQYWLRNAVQYLDDQPYLILANLKTTNREWTSHPKGYHKKGQAPELSYNDFIDSLSELDTDWKLFAFSKDTNDAYTRYFRKFLFSPEDMKSGKAREVTELGNNGGWTEKPKGYASVVVDVNSMATANEIDKRMFDLIIKPTSPLYKDELKKYKVGDILVAKRNIEKPNKLSIFYQKGERVKIDKISDLPNEITTYIVENMDYMGNNEKEFYNALPETYLNDNFENQQPMEIKEKVATSNLKPGDLIMINNVKYKVQGIKDERLLVNNLSDTAIPNRTDDFNLEYALANYSKIDKNVETKTIENSYTPDRIENRLLNPKGIQAFLTNKYDNQYQLNKGIEEFMTNKGAEPSTYSAEEKAFIKKYSGYGGLSKFGTAGKGAFFEYYTPTPVIRKMWALAYKYGYKGGSILESSVGTGEFLALAPTDASITAYEINPFSADICRILYPQAKVFTQPFEQNFIENNFTIKDRVIPIYDLCIGNCPYGSFEIVQSRYLSGMGELKHVQAKNYAEYFLRRSLDLLKPGGLLILIIGADVVNGGKLFLDSDISPVKEYLAEHSDLLDAYRLPDSVFERTQVTTEIVVIQKK